MVKEYWDRVQSVYEGYLANPRARLQVPPDVPVDDDEDVPQLDDDWGLEDLTTGAPLNAECVPLYKEMQDLCTA